MKEDVNDIFECTGRKGCNCDAEHCVGYNPFTNKFFQCEYLQLKKKDTLVMHGCGHEVTGASPTHPHRMRMHD